MRPSGQDIQIDLIVTAMTGDNGDYLLLELIPVDRLQRISREIDELTKAVLDTVTLKTALRSALPRAEAEAGTPDPS